MGSFDRNVVDLEFTPIFASMCEQFGLDLEPMAAHDPDDLDSGHRCGSLGNPAVEQNSHVG